MIRQQLFSLLTLLGCLAPWVTPRHFPAHPPQGTHESVVMTWVEQKNESQILPPDPVFEASVELAEQ